MVLYDSIFFNNSICKPVASLFPLKMLNFFYWLFKFVFTVLWILTYVQICIRATNTIRLQSSSITTKEFFILSPLSHSPSLVTTNLLFITIFLSFWDLSYKWSNIVCTLLKLASFTHHNAFKFHPCVLCIKDLFLSLAKLYSFVWMCQKWFIYSPSKGHLVFFLVWANDE